MRVENTGDGQVHLTLKNTNYAVPGKREGRNGSCDIPREALATLDDDADDSQRALFKGPTPRLLVIARAPALTNPSGSPEDVAKIEAAAAAARAEADAVAKADAELLALQADAAEKAKAADEAAKLAAADKPVDESTSDTKKAAKK